jgi:hypothetical protein
MANTFSRDDARTCFRCACDPPSFRLISLERFPNESRDLEPDCMTGLFCRACLQEEIREFMDSITQNEAPLGVDESCESFLCRQIGFTVVPLMLGDEESELLAEEIEADWLEAMVN